MRNKRLKKKYYQSVKNIHRSEGDMMSIIECFGDFLAKREKYKKLSGMEAIYYYLIQKYKWMPSQVRALNFEDLHLLMTEEMVNWDLPEEFN